MSYCGHLHNETPQAELGASVGYCIYTWPSQDRNNMHSAQLQNRAEHGLHSTVHHLLFGTQSCSLQVLQTDDVFGLIMVSNF